MGKNNSILQKSKRRIMHNISYDSSQYRKTLFRTLEFERSRCNREDHPCVSNLYFRCNQTLSLKRIDYDYDAGVFREILISSLGNQVYR